MWTFFFDCFPDYFLQVHFTFGANFVERAPSAVPSTLPSVAGQASAAREAGQEQRYTLCAAL